MKRSRWTSKLRVIGWGVFLFLCLSTFASAGTITFSSGGVQLTPVVVNVGETTKLIVTFETSPASLRCFSAESDNADLELGQENFGPLSYYYINVTGKQPTVSAGVGIPVAHYNAADLPIDVTDFPVDSATLYVRVRNPGDGIISSDSWGSNAGDGCADFAPATNILHIPHVDLGDDAEAGFTERTYWFNLEARRANGLTFVISDGGLNPDFTAAKVIPVLVENEAVPNPDVTGDPLDLGILQGHYATFDFLSLTLSVPCVKIAGTQVYFPDQNNPTLNLRLSTQGNSVNFRYIAPPPSNP